ncbi:MAG: hypothetical protein IJ438_05640 [Clostridia bacterium]|nr:hypothetical protein [Clostridia bacterium]
MKKNTEEISYWQSFTDILSSLLLVVMLVTVLLILYLMHAPEEEWTGYGDYTATPVLTVTPEFGDGDFDEGDDGDGGGSWHTPTPEMWVSPTPTVTITPTPTPYNPAGGGYGYGYDEANKAAVYAMIVDNETDRVIPKDGIIFELFDVSDVRQTLNTYYPEKVWYHEFTTTEAGTFFLPEKVAIKQYYFRALNAPEGYDDAEDVYFTLDEAYDWPAPYVVRIPFEPSKNVINVQMTDADTEENVGYGTFRVVAAEDIITPDGTLRYAKGEVADTIVCDAEGKGQSIELYLGQYTVMQETIPDYYAGLASSDTVDVRKKDATFDTAVYLNYSCRKTAMILTARDELYPNRVLEGAEFAVYREGSELNVQTMTTDGLGQLILTDLEKDSVYHIRQISTLEDYNFPEEEYTFTVTERGHIDEQAVSSMDVNNYIVRVAFAAVDALMRSSFSDISMGLYDEAGSPVQLWTTSAMRQTLEGLAPGRYSLVVDGDMTQQKSVTVEDGAQLQVYEYALWSGTDTIIVVCAVAGLCLLIAIVVRVRKGKKN